MNLRVVPGLVAWVSCLTVTHACGPFFPDTVLDKPQAALGVPPVSYLAGLYRMEGMPLPSNRGEQVDATMLSQIPLEAAELSELWKREGLSAELIAQRLQHYTGVRTSLLSNLTDIGISDFPTQQGAAAQLPERPLGADFPADVSDYVEAARLYAIGRSEDARSLWKGILEKPEAERRLRSTWAAWMLAKTAPTQGECLEWYRRVAKEAADGSSDVLKLGPAAKAWLAPFSEDPIAALHDFYEVFRTGKTSVEVDLRRTAEEMMANADPETLAKAAADPLARHLINLHLQAAFDQPREGPITASDEEIRWKPDAWLSALQAHAPLPLDDGSRIAWALYATAHFEEAHHWLDLSVQDDPLALWLRAKFDLRAGNLDAANQHLSEAIKKLSAAGDWNPSQWGDDVDNDLRDVALDQGAQGRLLGDAGIVALAREDYSQALESLRQGGFDEDAAYLAERVLSTDELLQHVRVHAPKWQSPEPAAVPSDSDHEPEPERHDIDPAECLTVGEDSWYERITRDNRLRWQLARRLARENRLGEAGEFMPMGLRSLWAHYVTLDTAAHDQTLSAQARAAIVWRQARIHRHWGAELFSTDTSPDGGIHGWDFEVTDLANVRSFQDGWSLDWEAESSPYAPAEFPGERAIPIISRDEARRVESHPLPNTGRFHYRYVAADLAWEAAKLLPDNDPQLAPLYNTAGQWISGRDPEAADRFYQAMVKRCKETDLGRAADKKRWFLQELEPLGELSGLPESLLPKSPPVE